MAENHIKSTQKQSVDEYPQMEKRAVLGEIPTQEFAFNAIGNEAADKKASSLAVNGELVNNVKIFDHLQQKSTTKC